MITHARFATAEAPGSPRRDPCRNLQVRASRAIVGSGIAEGHRMVIAYDASRSALYTPEKRETVFQSGVDYSPVQLAVEAARLAYYRAEVSPAQMQRLGEALARVGFAAPVMFIGDHNGAAGFGSVRARDGRVLLAFRGTQPDDFRDIKRDLGVRMVAWSESAGRVHAGFAAALARSCRSCVSGSLATATTRKS